MSVLNMLNVLVVDDESDIRDIISFYLEEYFNNSLIITHANGAPEAIEKISFQQFDLILCDHDMPTGNGHIVHRYILDKKIQVKYVVCSSVDPKDRPEFYDMNTLFFNIVKPGIEIGIKNLSTMIDFSQASVPLVGEYLPVGINLLYLMREMPTDIYISLSAQKYLKCFHRGEVFSDDDKKKYQSKDIHFLFAKIEGSHEHILNVINGTIGQILASKNKPVENKLLETHSQVSNLLKTYGFSSESIDIAKSTINETAKLLSKSEDDINRSWLRMNLFGEYPSKLYVLQSTLCGILGKKLNWSSENTLQKIVMASFFQDLNLDSLEMIKIVDYHEFLKRKDQFTSKERDNYLAHPVKAKEMISKIKNVPADVDKILFEQHELPNGDGFPRKLNSHQISPLSALLILTGVIAKTMLNTHKDEFNPDSFFSELQERGYNKGNYKEPFNHAKSFFVLKTT